MKRAVRQLLAVLGTDALLLAILLYMTLGGMGRKETREADSGAEGVIEMPAEKTIALTFDDGPHPIYTKELLEGLRERGVKATFFLMGANIEGNEELVLEMERDGHLIGNHGFRHEQMTEEGAEAVCESVEETGSLIKAITGKKPEYLRPPYGAWNEELAEELNLTPVFWSVDSLDWKYENTSQITQRVLKKVKNGDVILMHDIFSTSVQAALEIIDTLQAQGYTFVTADELVVD